MSLGDLTFIGVFILLPIAIAIWCLWTIRVFRRRAVARSHAKLAAEATMEFQPPRDWAAAVQPLRRAGTASRYAGPNGRSRPYRVPAYRGRSAGVVRRMQPARRLASMIEK